MTLWFAMTNAVGGFLIGFGVAVIAIGRRKSR